MNTYVSWHRHSFVPCLNYPQPYAFAFCLLSIFVIFIVELIAFRWGTAKLAKLGLSHGEVSDFSPFVLQV